MNVVMTGVGPVHRGAGDGRGHAVHAAASSTTCSGWPRRASARSSSCRRAARRSAAAPPTAPREARVVTVVLATANPDKAAEIATIARPLGIELLPRPRRRARRGRDADTLEGNARLKAAALAAATGDAGAGRRHRPRGRRPGRRARCALGPLRGRRRHLRRQRRAAARVARRPSRSSSGRRGSARSRWCAGPTAGRSSPKAWSRATSRRGAGASDGFGYDPVFIPDEGDGRTFAEMVLAREARAVASRPRVPCARQLSSPPFTSLRRSTAQVSTTSSPFTTCIRSW